MLRYNFVNAWPMKWNPADFNATGKEVAIEEFTLAHEGLELGVMLQTEHDFTLPLGYIDKEGGCTRQGSCGWPPRPTRSCRSATSGCATTPPT